MKSKLLNLAGLVVKPGIWKTLLFLAVFLPSTQAQAFDRSLDPKHVMVKAIFTNASIKEVLESIEKQTAFIFAYDESVLEEKKQISFDSKRISVSDLLQFVIKDTNLKIKQIESTFSITRTLPSAESYLIRDTFDIQISGAVTDLISGEPLIGATVTLKETNTGTITDHNGNYQIAIPDQGGTIIFSYLGYATLERFVEANTPTPINVTLELKSQAINEIVVIGYGTESKGNVSTAIAKLSAEEIRDQAITSFDQALAGRLAGVDISQSNGAPGASVNINIRGLSSITGGNGPLFVVDGVPLSSSANDAFTQGQSADGNFNTGYQLNSLSSINPNDIASIEILKDAASAAIYGSRGTNGVILVTTKSGQLGKKPIISLNTYYGIQEVTKKVDVMEAYEFAEYFKRSRDLSWIAKNPTQNTADDPSSVRGSGDRIAPYLIPYLNGEQGLVETDWQDEVFRAASIQNYEISATGGSKWLSYYVSGNYFDQEGVVINSGLKRYGARLNLKAKISDNIRFGINFNPSFSDHNIVQTEQNWWKEGIIISALMYHPNLPVYNADGSYALAEMIRTNREGQASVATIENPVALAESIDNTLEHTRLLGNSFLEVNFLSNFKFRTSLGMDLNFMERFYYRPKTLNWRSEYAPTATYNYAWSNSSTIYNWVNENTLNYVNSFGKHHINAIVGYTIQEENNQHQYLEGRNFPNDNITTLNAAQARTGISEERKWSLLSYLGRIQYNFDGKYLLTTSIRRDGSSRFGANSKWGWFPSVSAGWRIDKEGFFPASTPISDLKLRASYGLTGNTEIPFYGGTALLGIADYVLNDGVITGLAPVTSPNPNLSWETTTTLDVGIDLSFFNQKLSLSADYYRSNTKDLLLNVTIPSSSGFESSLQNIGEMQNTGAEFTLSTSQKIGQLTWNGALNFSFNRNEIVALAPGQTQFVVNSGLNDPAFIVRVGESIGSYFGYEVLGVFSSQEELDGRPKLENVNQQIGDFIYADRNNDGVVTADDRTVLGNNSPDYTWGIQSTFGYKNFDFSFNIQAKQGFELFNAMHRYLAEGWGNNLEVYLSKEAPRPVWGVGSASHTRPSSWHVEDGSFIRIRNLTLGYTLPSSLLSEKSIANLRIYASALNPFTSTNYSGYNPEVSNNSGDAVRAGEEFGNYPVSKSFMLGLNASF